MGGIRSRHTARHFFRVIGCLLAGLLTWLGPASMMVWALDAETLARQVYERPAGRDMVSRAQMLLSSKKSKRVRKRRFYTYRLDKGGGERWSLVRFIAPADVRNTGLLSLHHASGDVEQWLYLPALHRVRRIASNRRGGRFVGSDFYYEDLHERDPDKDRHELRGQGKVGGLLCEILVSTPKDPKSSVYSKRVSWILPRALVPLRIDYYRRGRSKPVKRMLVHRLKRIQGYWTVLDSSMTDLKSGHRTRVKVEAIRYDQGLPEKLFTRQALADPALEAPYRP